MRAVVPAVLIALTITGTASGYSVRTEAALDVAMHHWQSRAAATGMHICGDGRRPTVTWTPLGARVGAQAWPGLCLVEVNVHGAMFLRERHWGLYCTILVHEVGHLAGHQHSRDPGDVMSPLLHRPTHECRVQARRRGWLPAR